MATNRTKKEKPKNHFGLGMVLGAAVGYVVSYFTASKAGSELQEELARKAQAWKEIGQNAVHDLKESIKEDTYKEPVPKENIPEPFEILDDSIQEGIILVQTNEYIVNSTDESEQPLS